MSKKPFDFLQDHSINYLEMAFKTDRMAKCTRHPERETRFQCLKHDLWMCDECFACRDPELYCKHRSACLVWFIEKPRKRPQKPSRSPD
jgi:hypothetical protein